jgi:hypothetical protein
MRTGEPRYSPFALEHGVKMEFGSPLQSLCDLLEDYLNESYNLVKGLYKSMLEALDYVHPDENNERNGRGNLYISPPHMVV